MISKLNQQDLQKWKQYDVTGYHWFSNKKSPVEVLEAKRVAFDCLVKTTLPFTVEAKYWCKSENKSLSIKYVEGEYYIHEANWGEVPDQLKRKRMSRSVRNEERSLAFIEVFEEKEDPIVSEFSRKTLIGVFFTGFNKASKSNIQ